MTDEATPRDRAAVRIPPPLVALAGLLAGVALSFVLPLSLPIGGAVRFGLAALILALGLVLIVGAMGRFRSTGQDPKPWESTPEIISTGVYRFTRNPMYVSMGLLMAAIGVAMADGWLLLLIVPVWATIYGTAIRHEEAYLERKFGSVYTDYKESVRRWV